jgi:TldD protein
MPATHKLLSIVASICFLSLLVQPARAESAPGQKDGSSAQKDTSAAEKTRREIEGDGVLKAMKDELDRSIKQLQVSGKAKPYYIQYYACDSDWQHSSWQLGAQIEGSTRKERRIEIDLRVGDYSFDNSAELSGTNPSFGNRMIPLDDDNYWGIRRGFWLLTDESYKTATEHLEKMDTYKQGHAVRNLCDSLSREPANIQIGERSGPLKLTGDWAERMRRLSLVFADYPEIRKAWVTFDAVADTERVVTTEGTVVRRQDNPINIGIAAYALTQDRSEVWDSDYVRTNGEAAMPDQTQLEAKVRQLADNLTANIKAERLDYYFGPILFEGQSACELVCHGIAPLLCAIPSDNLHPHNTLLRSLNNRVMPRFLSIVDDPTLRTFQDTPIAGLWDSDTDGMPSRKTQLIDHGFLRDLLSSRTPVFPGEHSNGHDFSGDVVPTTLVVEAHSPVTKTALRRKLLEMAKQKGLKEALIVRRICPRTAQTMSGDAISIRSDALAHYLPAAIFSVDVATGAEKRIRGLKFGEFDRARMEAVAAAGNDSKAYFTVNWCGYVHSLVTPSLLVNDMELEEDTTPTFSPYPLDHPEWEKQVK